MVQYLINLDKSIKDTYENYQDFINSSKEKDFKKFKSIVNNKNKYIFNKMKQIILLWNSIHIEFI